MSARYDRAPRRPVGAMYAPLTPSSSVLGHALPLYLRQRAPRKDSPATTTAVTGDVRTITELLAQVLGKAEGDVTVDDLRLRALRGAFAAYSDTHAAASIARVWSTWNGFCTFLVTEGVSEGSPMGGVQRPRTTRSTPKALRGGDATALQLLQTLAARPGAPSTPGAGRDPWPELDLAVIATLLVTGLRSAELLALTLNDVHGAAGEQRLHVKGKGGVERSVPIEASLVRLLDDYLASRAARFPSERRPLSPRAPLFVDRTGRAMARGQLQYLVAQAYRRAGIADRVPAGAMAHALRHTFATQLVRNGASVVEAMRLLGHRSLNTTQRYLDASPDELRSAAAANPTYASLHALAAARHDDHDPTPTGGPHP